MLVSPEGLLFGINALPTRAGVYIIENTENGKCYIGQARNLRKRGQDHRSRLRCKTHANRYLQNAFDADPHSFKIEVLMECPEHELDYWEDYYIDTFGSWQSDKGYNLAMCSTGVGMHSEETKHLIGNAWRGKKRPIEQRLKQGATRSLTFHPTPESNSARSEAMSDRVWVNDGARNRRLKPGEPVPNGWTTGKRESPDVDQSKKGHKGHTTFKDPATGETAFMRVDDPRVVSGGWVHVTAKPDPDGLPGCDQNRAKGSMWVNDGQRSRRVPKGTPLPGGWRPGRC
jgi:group I intron endonuclease